VVVEDEVKPAALIRKVLLEYENTVRRRGLDRASTMGAMTRRIAHRATT